MEGEVEEMKRRREGEKEKRRRKKGGFSEGMVGNFAHASQRIGPNRVHI